MQGNTSVEGLSVTPEEHRDSIHINRRSPILINFQTMHNIRSSHSTLGVIIYAAKSTFFHTLIGKEDNILSQVFLGSLNDILYVPRY
jgi:hypothetical protein